MTRQMLWISAALCVTVAAALAAASKQDASTSQWTPLPTHLKLPHLTRVPVFLDIRLFPDRKEQLKELPKRSSEEPSATIDLRSRDASKLDLRQSAGELALTDFDLATQWPKPDMMPKAWDPRKALELGKNPGLGIRALHAKGIDGRGISIGIIDQALSVRHEELADHLLWYEEYAIRPDSCVSMHGPAVASIAVGKTVGVAPKAGLVYIGSEPLDRNRLAPVDTECIRRLLKINAKLPKDRKIRAISLSIGFDPGVPGYDEFIAATREAEAEGIFVSWCGNRDYPVFGLAIAPTGDRDDFQAYTRITSWGQHDPSVKALLVPIDHRTVASFSNATDYCHYSQGGLSWAAPYVAGAYALAAQVDPTVTPKRFWELALKTGRKPKSVAEAAEPTQDVILDVPALIKALKKP